MADASRWLSRTMETRYRFVRVDRETGAEKGVIPVLRGGTVTRNNDVRILETAEVGLVGALDIGPDLVRIYMEPVWPDGHTESVPIGTFLASVPKREVRQGYSTATVKLSGRLQELLDDAFAEPYSLKKGANAVDVAANVVRDMGLEVVADDSDYTISKPRVYGIGADQSNTETGRTKLDMVNDLLDLAGFLAAKTDPMGRVLLKKYVEPNDRPVAWEFEEGPLAKFEGEMSEERDTTSVANRVVVVYGTEGETIVAEAWDRDPESEFSTVNVGRTITQGYTYSELPEGKTKAARREVAQRNADNLLKTAQAIIHRVTMRGAYAPVSVNDAVNLVFPSAGIEGKFEIRTQKLSLSGGCPTDFELRQWER